MVDMRNAHSHISHRLDPAWKKTEPVAVVNACKQFVTGYDVIAKIYKGLLDPVNA